ncbi:hypothetical protein [Chlorobium sp. N1]|uniref:hypothetical protein n=1 Tax=Chlorobium sp. N1 TaxID=2491138 RepID=UPI00103D69E6|nr:hypothetical protein [Chlorobium sp. N1]TCD47004.1 hypothetical protein E0L29_10230 [Chlorobium sp. N1]
MRAGEAVGGSGAAEGSGGWVKLHRQLAQWEWYTDANTFRLFVHLLLMANHADTRWRGQRVRRGQVLTGLEQLSGELRLSVKRVRVALEHLVSTGEVTNRSTNRYRVITITNYSFFQGGVEPKRQAGRRAEGKEDGPKEGRQRAASKKGKNEKNEESLGKGEAEGLLNPGFSEGFMHGVWAFYAANKSRPYRNARVQNVALRQLHEMSGGSEECAGEALRQTLANGYQGFTWYFSRNQQPNLEGGSHGRGAEGPAKSDHAALMQAIADRAKGMG